jgi:Xaa-Pro aminopeptidase
MKNLVFNLLKKTIQESGLDSVIIGKNANVRYLTGFTGDYSFALVGRSEALLITSQLYNEQAHLVVGEPFKVIAFTDDIFECFSNHGNSFWGEKVGYESDVMSCSFFEKLSKKLPGVDFVPTSDLVEKLREAKYPSEIRCITHAQEITDRVFHEVLGLIHEGIEERDLACEIDYQFRKKGGERSAFETIVVFGAFSSQPHAIPTGRKLKYDDLVLFDMGTVIEGYAADMTRTVVFGKADSEKKTIYNLVFDAQKAALDAVAAGKKCSEIYAQAFRVFEKAGYGNRFIHTLGHGIGLEVHESPRLSPKNHSILKKNCVVTVEPGLYIPGWGGVRIEDMVIVDEHECANLTHSPKYLLEL